MDVLTPDFVENLFRVAVVQTGDRELALSLVSVALCEAQARSSQWRTLQPRFLWAVRHVCEQCRKILPTPLSSAQELPEAFSEVLGSFRSIRAPLLAPLALHLVGSARPAEILELFNIRSKEWRAALVQWESNLSMLGIDVEEARGIVGSIALSDEDRSRLEQVVRETPVRPRGMDRFLAVGAVLLGLTFLLGWVGWERWRDSVPVRMRLQMESLLQLSREAGSFGFEAFRAPAGETPDWLFLHGIEGVHVPHNFAGLELDGGRVLSWNGSKMALFTMTTIPGFFAVAEAQAAGLAEEDTGAGLASFGEWSGAWEVVGAYVVLCVAKTDVRTLEEALKKAKG